jgi:hypothetical protein
MMKIQTQRQSHRSRSGTYRAILALVAMLLGALLVRAPQAAAGPPTPPDTAPGTGPGRRPLDLAESPSSGQTLRAISCGSATTCVTGGDFGALLGTSNGGSHWTSLPSVPNLSPWAPVTAVHFITTCRFHNLFT